MSDSLPSAHLPVVRLHLSVQVHGPLQLPAYAGSMLRGAWGHALLRLAPLPHAPGQPCALQAGCPYCQVFAPQPLAGHSLQKFSQMPAPYVVEPPAPAPGEPWQPLALRAGEGFDFSLVLMGRALRHWPSLLLAWQQALQKGLGTQHTTCTLLAVRQEGVAEPLWQDGQAGPSAQPVLPAPAVGPSLGTAAILHLLSPLRLQQQGQPLRQHQLRAYTLLMALARRHQLLQDVCWGPQAPQHDFARLKQQAEGVQIDARELRWFDWGRYSSSQQQSMKLGGLLGPLHLEGDLAPFSHLLHLGQWLHVGKETTFGLGAYRLA